MQVVIFTHPDFFSSQSMPKFAKLIVDGMGSRGHHVDIWQAKSWFSRLPFPPSLKKWLGYIDQYVVFPAWVRYRLMFVASETVFVFTDQAMGPWVSLVVSRPHVIHVHDFMALRASLGEFRHYQVSWTGRLYQQFIRRGFSKGKRFIAVSANSETDLLRFLPSPPAESLVVHNGLNYPFRPLSRNTAEEIFSQSAQRLPDQGFLLHVGGNSWYKNRVGVLAIYAAYVKSIVKPLPLLMIGAKPSQELLNLADKVSSSGEIKFIVGVPTEMICAAYSTASALIFPSIAEGFGWPILEAMSCGCPVLTTDEAPMSEVGGDVATYLPRLESRQSIDKWATESARVLLSLLVRGDDEMLRIREAGLAHARLFDTEKSLDAYEVVYKRAVVECCG